MLALSQSIPPRESIAAPAVPGSSSFVADSNAADRAQMLSSSPSFSETLASLQMENTASNLDSPVSFASSKPFQSGTTQYSTHYASQSSTQSSTQSLIQDSASGSGHSSNGSPSASVQSPADQAPSDGSQTRQHVKDYSNQNSSSQNSFGQDASSLNPKSPTVVQASTGSSQTSEGVKDSTGDDPKMAATVQATADTEKKSVESTPTNISIVSTGVASTTNAAAPPEQSAVTDDSMTAPAADQRHLIPVQSPAAQPTSAVAAKAVDLSKQEVGKRHRKANEAAPAAAASDAPTDSVTSTLLMAANASGTASANAGAITASADSDAPALVGGNQNSLAAAPPSTNPLAFAIKVHSAGAAPANGDNAIAAATQPDAPSADQGFSRAAGPQQAASDLAPVWQQPASLNGAAGMAQLSIAAGFAPATNSSPSLQASGSEANSAAISETEGPDADNLTASATTPLRSMQVQINGQDNQRIDLRLVERSGSLSMSVRSLDSNLNRSLQDHLPELMTKLSDQPGQAEWWTPTPQAAAGGNGSGDGGGNKKEDSAGSQGQQNQPGQDASKQQSGRESNRPKWVEELATLNTSKTTRKETIWHQ